MGIRLAIGDVSIGGSTEIRDIRRANGQRIGRWMDGWMDGSEGSQVCSIPPHWLLNVPVEWWWWDGGEWKGQLKRGGRDEGRGNYGDNE